MGSVPGHLLRRQAMSYYKARGPYNKEPAIVYRTLGGYTYRVLDLFDQERFGGIYPTIKAAKQAVIADGYYVATEPTRRYR